MGWRFATARRRAPGGVTLVELLVVVAMIAVLAAMLLPALQQARETARRAQCQNNLRQLAIAAALHANAQGAFPVGCIGGRQSADKRCISWNVQLLPFIERGELWTAFDFSVPSYDPANKPVRDVLVDTFLCPSTHELDRFSPKDAWKEAAFTDYGGIYGVEGTGRDRQTERSHPAQTLSDDSLGVMLYEEAVAPKQITDGLSKTACIAELSIRRVPAMTEWVNGLNVFAQEQSTPMNGVGLDNEIGSPHPGGAMLAFCDGHVEFVAETIEQALLNALLSRAGND